MITWVRQDLFVNAIFQEFQDRREMLGGLRELESHARIVGLLDWLDEQTQIRPILDHLRAEVNAASLVHTGPSRRPPQATTPNEVRAFGLFLMDQCRAGSTGLFAYCHKFHIRPRYPSNQANDYIAAAMDGFIVPFLDYLEQKLVSLEAFSPSSLVDASLTKLYQPEFRSRFPETAASIEKLSAMCNAADTHESWFAVATVCRELLDTYGKEFRSRQNAVIPPEVKDGDLKGILKACISQYSEAGRYSNTLASLLTATWDHTQCLLHRKMTTKDELLRLVLFVNLTISEIALLGKTARDEFEGAVTQ
jgi:hypothetical protein